LGAKSFREDALIRGATEPEGRTFIDATPVDRCLQNSAVKRVDYLVDRSGPLAMKIKIFRPHDGKFNLVGESEVFEPVRGSVQQRVLARPIHGVIPGDFIGCWFGATATEKKPVHALTRAKGPVLWSTGDSRGTNQAFPNSIPGMSLPLEVFGDPPVAVVTGDSIEAGHGSHYESYLDETGPAGDQRAELALCMRSIIGKEFTYQDYASGSKTWQWVNVSAMPAILFGTGVHASAGIGMQEIWCHCGVNDIQQNRSWEAVRADLDEIYEQLPRGCALFIDEILPDSNFDDAKSAQVRAFNRNYVEWAKGKLDVRIVRCHDTVGEVRQSTGQIDNLKAEYGTGDGVHLNKVGAEAVAARRAAERTEYYTQISKRSVSRGH